MSCKNNYSKLTDLCYPHWGESDEEHDLTVKLIGPNSTDLELLASMGEELV